MTKRTLPLLLLLALACAAGCEPKKDTPNQNANVNTNPAANVGGRQTNANLNANAGVNANIDNPVAPPLHTKEDKSVVIIVTEDSSGKLQILVSPESIKLLKSKNNKLRFLVVNNTEVDLKEVVVTFVTTNPMDGDFTVGGINAGYDNSSPTRKIKGDAAAGKYTYGIKAYGHTSAEPVAVMNSPEVEIAT